ncbi:MAG TPA: hypothetical protein VKA32_06455, partial [Gammaproteobacteria bacterium]|nr:hypothetical protein [Gammaproteobacteria bacterium]
VDDAVRALLCEADERATTAISDNLKGFDRLVATLEEKETLDRDAIEQCLGRTDATAPATVHPWPERGDRPSTTRTR